MWLGPNWLFWKSSLGIICLISNFIQEKNARLLKHHDQHIIFLGHHKVDLTPTSVSSILWEQNSAFLFLWSAVTSLNPCQSLYCCANVANALQVLGRNTASAEMWKVFYLELNVIFIRRRTGAAHVALRPEEESGVREPERKKPCCSCSLYLLSEHITKCVQQLT